MLSVLDQNRDMKWNDLIDSIEIEKEEQSDMPEISDSDSGNGLAEFSL